MSSVVPCPWLCVGTMPSIVRHGLPRIYRLWDISRGAGGSSEVVVWILGGGGWPAIVAGTSLLCVSLLWWCRAGFVCVSNYGRVPLELPLCSAEFQPIKIRTQKETGTQKTPDILILILILTLILCMGFPRIQGFNFWHETTMSFYLCYPEWRVYSERVFKSRARGKRNRVPATHAAQFLNKF